MKLAQLAPYFNLATGVILLIAALALFRTRKD